MLARPLLIFFLAFAFTPSLSLAQDDFFSDIEVDVDSANASISDKPWSITGWLKEKVAYGLKDPGQAFSREHADFDKVETSVFSRLDWQLGDALAMRVSAKISADAIYQLKDEDSFHQDEVDEFEIRFELKDFYLESQFTDSIYLKGGQQVLAWGQAENVRVVDLINTQDRFTFGQQDLEDLRLPVPALLTSLSQSSWVFDGVVTFKAGSDDIAPALDEFDPYVNFRNNGIYLSSQDPDNELEFLIRASTHYQSGDFSIVIADVNENSLSVDSIDFIGMQTLVEFNQDRFKALGMSVNWTGGSWLVFSDMGVHFDKALQPNGNSIFQFTNGWLEKDQFLFAAGIEYSGWNQWVLTFEADYINTMDHDSRLQVDRNQLGFSGRFRWDGMNDRIQILGVWSQLPDDNGRIARLSVDYEWSDALEFGLLWVDYRADASSLLGNFRNNDVLQLQLAYSFQH